MATRNDVAKRAGVSGATVTRVLSSPKLVSEHTREKVMQAVRELNYHPNYSGQILKEKCTRQVLFFCPDFYNPFYVHVFYGMDDYAQKQKYNIVLTRHFDKESIQRGRYDGIIFCALDDNQYSQNVQFLEDIGMPYVTAAFYQKLFHAPNVAFDYNQCTGLVIDHLYKLGHREIAYVSDTSNYDNKYNAVLNNIQSKSDIHCTRLLLNPAPELYENLYEAGSLYAEKIYRMLQLPTAIIAANDALATGLISGLTHNGIHIPNDLSVISFDDTFMTRFIIPPLTTIHFPKYEMGQTLMKVLLSVIEGNPCENVALPSRLIIRESTAPLKHE